MAGCAAEMTDVFKGYGWHGHCPKGMTMRGRDTQADPMHGHRGDTDDHATQIVLRGVNLRVEAGRSLAVIGPSGCGKSTLLNLLGGLDMPEKGKVELDGKDLSSLDERALADCRARKIGFVFQLHHLLPQCTVRENVLAPTLALGRCGAAQQQRAEELLKRVGLVDRMNHLPGELSGGERQRAAVVRALINQPRLLLADEPTGSLDAAAARAMADLLCRLKEEHGLTLIVVTHSLELAGRMERRLELRDGRLVGEDAT